MTEIVATACLMLIAALATWLVVVGLRRLLDGYHWRFMVILPIGGVVAALLGITAIGPTNSDGAFLASAVLNELVLLFFVFRDVSRSYGRVR
jgi:hypothetical protein